MNKYFYTYEILIDNPESSLHNSVYYGKHETSNLDDGYLGSGKLLSNYRKKYGKIGLTKTILNFYNNSEDLAKAEKVLVESKKQDLGRRCLNLRDGGNGGDIYSYMSPSEQLEYKRKISKSNKGKRLGMKLPQETKDKISEANRGHIAWNKGKHHSEETKQKMSESQKGKHTGELNPRYGKDSPMKGKHHSEETKHKISEKAKERFQDPTNNPMYGKHHTEETKQKISEKNKGRKRVNRYNLVCKLCGQYFISKTPRNNKCPDCRGDCN